MGLVYLSTFLCLYAKMGGPQIRTFADFNSLDLRTFHKCGGFADPIFHSSRFWLRMSIIS
jgi:hypothetical protein